MLYFKFTSSERRPPQGKLNNWIQREDEFLVPYFPTWPESQNTCSVEWWIYWWIMCWKGFGTKRKWSRPIWGSIATFVRSALSTSEKIDKAPVKIRTEHLQNTNLERCRYTSLHTQESFIRRLHLFSCHLLAVCLSSVGTLTSRNPMIHHGL
jgi:hypothetical protein